MMSINLTAPRHTAPATSPLRAYDPVRFEIDLGAGMTKRQIFDAINTLEMAVEETGLDSEHLRWDFKPRAGGGTTVAAIAWRPQAPANQN